MTDDLAAGLVVGLAFPERVAKVRAAGTRTYLMAGGTAAELAPGSALTGSMWLAIAVADRAAGSVSARIRLAVPIDEATARQAAAPLLTSADEVEWSDGDVLARAVVRLGAIAITQERLAHPDPGLVAATVAAGLRTEGWVCCPGDARRRRCATGSPSATWHWATRGQRLTMRRCSSAWPNGWARSWRGHVAAATWPGSTSVRRCADCSAGGRRPGWTRSRRSG